MEKEKSFFMPSASDTRINHSDGCNALEAHYLRAKKQMENDKRALEIMIKGLDVPVSHIHMKIFVRDNRAVCPSCSGLVIGRQNLYTCIDCRQEYVGIAAGRLEGEVIVVKPVAMEKDKNR